MAKKFVRGITGIKNIKKQDLDTNNVNDLLSDGEHNYIHRKKKDKTEEYHNLTNNLKTIDSDNTALLSVTNYNNTKNSATLHPHHDAQKEQVLQSTNNTVTITHGENGTTQKTNVDVNPKKVLTHDKLVSNSQYVTVSHNQNSDTTEIKTDALASKISELTQAVESGGGSQKPLVSPDETINILENTDNTFVGVNLEVLIPILADIFQGGGTGGGTQGQVEYYHHANASLQTVTKPLNDTEKDFYLLLHMHKGKTQASFELFPDDAQAFTSLIHDFGFNIKLDINGVVFTIDGNVLTVTTNNAIDSDFVTSFSTIVYVENSSSGGGGFN